MTNIHPFNPPLPDQPRAQFSWPAFSGSSLSLALCALAKKSNALVVVVGQSAQFLQQLQEEIDFFREPLLSCHQFPAWETLPYDQFSAHQDIISERLKALANLSSISSGLLLATVDTLMQRLPPKEYIYAHTLSLKKGQRISLETLRQQFSQAGYQYVAQVLSAGEFAVRGSLFDIFPMGSSEPYRIDLFGDDIESISIFDPETQRTASKIDEIQLLPAREFPLDEKAIQLFRQQWRENFAGNPTHAPIYEMVSQGSSVGGLEYYLPLFFAQTQTLFDYLPQKVIFVRLEKLSQAADIFWQELSERYEQLRHDHTRPILPPDKLFLTHTDLFSQLKQFSGIEASFTPWTAPDVFIDHKAKDPHQRIRQFYQAAIAQQKRLLFCAESAGRREALLALLREADITPKNVNDWFEFLASDFPCAIAVAPLNHGMELTDPAVIVIPESVLLGQQVIQARRRKTKTTDTEAIVRNLAELRVGQPVVHVQHGVGRYLGLQTLTLDEQLAEYLTLEYARGDKLYVPVASLHLISRYSGMDSDHAPLHKLGTDQWEKAKRKAREKVCDVAAELLVIHAKRAMRKGHAFVCPEESYRLFAASFPFEETPDQQQAIVDVLNDMRLEKSMDRLVCGDVGFGKTEVAMRAAFVAVQDGKQVAVLVPTTLLAQQHFQNFSDRFADWPVKVEMLSRFRSAAEQEIILDQLKDGKVDIIIGTHKLLQKNIHFKQLGLMMIDEEHRFGVRQKEQLKALRAEVDILTLTATPIPRTLNMAMSGMRDLSIIGTPPAKRLAIKTFVHVRENRVIREALLREILRGGQVYYLHNNVETILRTAEELRELVPEARIEIAHGQMPERQLEKIMRDFYHQRFNVLICTTIIETGIDIPSANTIIMDRADQLGLAQMHQLRGRVGRSHHQAYAYLLTPPQQKLTSDAQKRLDAISMLEDLGVGFALATHDLEIRGAGELLGENQSGDIQEIGFALYTEMLDKAVRALKSGIAIEDENIIEVNLHIPALIPEDYVPDVHSRLILYKRMASAKDEHDLDELKVEFIDRFGLLPEPVQYLFTQIALKLTAQKLGVIRLDANPKASVIEFSDKPYIDPLKLIKLIQLEPHRYRFDGKTKLRMYVEQVSPHERLHNIDSLFKRLV